MMNPSSRPLSRRTERVLLYVRNGWRKHGPFSSAHPKKRHFPTQKFKCPFKGLLREPLSIHSSQSVYMCTRIFRFAETGASFLLPVVGCAYSAHKGCALNLLPFFMLLRQGGRGKGIVCESNLLSRAPKTNHSPSAFVLEQFALSSACHSVNSSRSSVAPRLGDSEQRQPIAFEFCALQARRSGVFTRERAKLGQPTLWGLTCHRASRRSAHAFPLSVCLSVYVLSVSLFLFLDASLHSFSVCFVFPRSRFLRSRSVRSLGEKIANWQRFSDLFSSSSAKKCRLQVPTECRSQFDSVLRDTSSIGEYSTVLAWFDASQLRN